MLCEPAQVRPFAFKQTRKRFDQHRKRGLPTDATRVTEGQDPLYPAIALLAPGPLAAFAPQDAEAVGAFRDVLGRFDTLNVQKHPQRLPFPCQATGKRPGFVFPGGVLVAQRVEARIPRPSLPHGGALRAHRTEPLERGVYPPTKASHTGFHTLCEPFRRADEMR